MMSLIDCLPKTGIVFAVLYISNYILSVSILEVGISSGRRDLNSLPIVSMIPVGFVHRTTWPSFRLIYQAYYYSQVVDWFT